MEDEIETWEHEDEDQLGLKEQDEEGQSEWV